MQELIKRLRSFAEYEADLADESKWERIEWEAADLIESQAAEIEKYKALCDQMGNAMHMHGTPFLHHELRYMEALEAWRALK